MSTNIHKNIFRFQEEPESPGFDSRYRKTLPIPIFFLHFFFGLLLEHIVVFRIMSDVLFFLLLWEKAFFGGCGVPETRLFCVLSLPFGGRPLNAPDH